MGYFLEENEVCLPEIVPVVKFSWTEEFLQQMRAIATAAEFADPGIEEMDTVDNIAILVNHPGDRHWRFYRPDPHGFGRVRSMDLQVTMQMTLSDVQRRIEEHWPDLVGGVPGWELIDASPTVGSSFQVWEEMEIFLIKADVDHRADEGELIVLVETQTWLITDAWIAPDLQPMVIERQWQPHDLVQRVGWTEDCERVLCPVTCNGLVRRPEDHLNVGHGAYLIVHLAPEASRIQTVTANLASTEGHFMTLLPRPDPRDLPADAFRRVMHHMGPLLGLSLPKVQINVQNFQIALTDAYRYLFWHSGLKYIMRPMLALFHASDPPGRTLTFTRFRVDWPLNIPFIFSELMEYELIPERDWTLVFMSHHIGSLWLPQDAQYFGIVGETQRQMPLSLNLVLFEVHFACPDGSFRDVADHRALMAREATTWFEVIHMLDLLDVCLDNQECVIQVEDRFLRPDMEEAYLFDGSVSRIWIGSYTEPSNASEKLRVELSDEEEAQLPTEIEEAHSGQQRHRTTQEAFAPVSGGIQMMIMVMLVIHSCRAKRCWRHGSVLKVNRARRSRRRSGLRLRSCRRPRSCHLKTSIFLCLLAGQILAVDAKAAGPLLPTSRIGEASHPGPVCHIGTSNPGGIRGKEMIYGQLPFGVWGIAETHLAQPGLRSVRSAFHRAGKEYNRQFAVLPGAMVPLRSRSTTTGTWAGVMTVGDLILRPVHINWPNNEYLEGRVQLTECWLGPFSITGAQLYGWPSGLTYPQALHDTNAMLETVVKELVISKTGPRYIMGDFNHAAAKLSTVELLKTYGWIEIQELGYQRGDWEPIATCRGATTIDFVFISPEMIPFFRRTRSWPWFADHVIVGAEFDFPILLEPQRCWPQPGRIPWHDVQWDAWRAQTQTAIAVKEMNINEAYALICQKYEDSFNGYINTADGLLPTGCKGRGQRAKPSARANALPLLRPSRPGEAQQSTEVLGRTPQKWFIQLRRIQSLLHALRAGKETAEAQQYRAELWGAILRGRGFQGGFSDWWKTRPVRLQGSPSSIPLTVPSLALAVGIFRDFEANYKKMESWHQRHRHELLNAYFQEHQDKLFSLMKPEGKAPLQHLVETQTTEILAISDDQQMIHTAEEIKPDTQARYDIDGTSVEVRQVDGPVVSIAHENLFQQPCTFTAKTHFATPNAIIGKLEEFWAQRWWKSTLPSSSDWNRMFAFAEQYLPRERMHCSLISEDQWTEVNKRYGPRSARGPDSMDRRDLQWLLPELQESLINLLNHCESLGQWPDALLAGFVYPLPKKPEGTTAGDFRPVILYSMIYRSWSSLRAKECLRHLEKLVDRHQFGFLPGREAVQVWFTIQAYLEISMLAGRELCGWVTDIQKAFENIPREPIKWLSIKLGVHPRIVNFWHNFLDNTVRYFSLHGVVGQPMLRNSGYPEGCAMSCFAMGLADLVFHLYMQAYSQMVTPVSYVDNFELIANTMEHLQHGILCTEEWSDMWQMSLDKAKSFVWGSSAKLRKECQAMGWKLRESAVDLGANMVYGKKNNIQGALERLNSIKPLWDLLKRLPAADWKKHQILQQCIWAKAFYGCSNSPLGKTHIQDLRSAAMKSLRRNRAGANPLLALSTQEAMTCDPGFYQLWNVLTTFKRMLDKQPHLVEMWNYFMNQYAGRRSIGPFGKLLEVAGEIGWSIEVPGFYDHDGFWVSFLDTTEGALRGIAEDAWCQYVARTVNKRKDFEGLQGFDLAVFRAARKRLDARERKILQAVQDGSFLDARAQSKFDLSKSRLCTSCGEDDTHEHRCFRCCDFSAIQAKHQEIIEEADGLTLALRAHLVPSRNEFFGEFKLHLAKPEYIERRALLRGIKRIDLFTDGSCWNPELPDYAIGAWSVVCPQADQWVARGTLSGLRQNNDKAEVIAIKQALDISFDFPGEVIIWSDSAFATSGLHRLLADPHDSPEDHGDGLWVDIQGLVSGRAGALLVQHIAAHRAAWRENDPVDAWTAEWNDRADREAGAAQLLRGPDFMGCRDRLLHAHKESLHQLQLAQKLHLDISNHRLQAVPHDDEEEGDQDSAMRDWRHGRLLHADSSWLSAMDPNWLIHLPGSDLVARFGMKFSRAMIQWLHDQRDGENSLETRWTWLEMAIYWLKTFEDKLPSPTSRGTWEDALRGGRHRPTVAAVVHLVRRFFHFVGPFLGVDILFSSGQSLLPLGFFPPQGGLHIKLSPDVLQEGLNTLQVFQAHRPIRVVNDLTRPLR